MVCPFRGRCERRHCVYPDGSVGIDGGVQVIGLGLLLVGAVLEAHETSTSTTSYAILPFVGTDYAGLAVAAWF